MTSRALYAPQQREIDLSALSAHDYRLIIGLHGQIGRGDCVLLCLATKGDRELTVFRHGGGAYYARHFPGGAHGDHKISRMTPEHERGRETWLTAWDRAGIPFGTEVSTDNQVRFDAIAFGEHVTGLEVQVGHQTAAGVKGRDTKRRRARKLIGQHAQELAAPISTVWFAPVGRPDWLYTVPSIECANQSWQTTPDPRKVTAIGVRSIDVKPCGPQGWFPRCPEKRHGWCGKSHLWSSPRPGFSVADIAEMVPAGELLAVQLPAGIYLTDRHGYARCKSFGYVRPELPVPIPGRRRDECASPAHARAAVPIDPRSLTLPTVPASAYRPCPQHGKPWCTHCFPQLQIPSAKREDRTA